MPLVVNLFAGPGAGKSTLAAGIFSELKQRGVCAELAPEFAKDLTWEGGAAALSCQPYILGNQIWRIERPLIGGADVVVTDSPALLGGAYGGGPEIEALALAFHRKYTTLNLRVSRAKPYETRGRNQTAQEARELDWKIDDMLVRLGVSPRYVCSSSTAATGVAAHVISLLRGAE